MSRRDPHSHIGAPVVILPLPTQQMQTVLVQTVAVHERRRLPRHFPLQGWDGDEILETLQPPSQTLGAFSRNLGPQAPQIILPLPTLAMMTVSVVVCAVRTRLTMPRRAPHYFITPGVVEPMLQMPDRRLYVQVDLQAVATRIASKLRQPHSKLLTLQLLSNPPPTAAIQVTLVNTRRDWQRRAPHYRLAAPAVVEPSLLGSDRRLLLDVELQAVPTRFGMQRRAPHSVLYPPSTLEPYAVALRERTLQVDAQAIWTRVTVQRRGPFSRLYPPATLEAYAVALRERTIQVDTQALPNRLSTRRAPHSFLAPPSTLEPESVALQERSPRVWLAGRTRVETQRRASHYRLYPGIAEPQLTMPDRRLYVQVDTQAIWTRTVWQRHFVHSLLSPPATLEAYAVALRERTIQVDTQAIANRLSTRRAPHSVLSPSATLEAESVQIAERTIRVTLAGRARVDAPKRAPHSHLYAPTAVQSATLFYGPTVTLATQKRLARRPFRSHLAPPAVTEPSLLGSDPRLRIAVTLSERTRVEAIRHAPHSFLHRGVVEPALQMPDRRLYVQVDTQALWTRTSMVRRTPRYFINPPPIGVTAPPAPTDTTILVSLVSVPTRAAAPRRAPHFRLFPPAVVEPSLLGSDRRLLLDVELQAVPARVALIRRAPRYFLYPPATLEPEFVSLRERTIDTELVAVTDRLIRVRRGPHSFVAPPATLEPAETQLLERTVRVWLGGRTRVELQRRASHYALKPGIVEPSLRPPDRRLRISATLAPAPRQPRRTHAFYRGPVTYPAFGTVTVWLAGRTRVEVQRRASHYRVGAPTTLQTFAGPAVTLATVPSRVALTRRAPHYRLQPPTVTRQLTLAQQTIRVTTVAVRTRVEHSRHVVESVLHPPTKVQPPVPPVKVAIGVTTTIAQFTRESLVRRGPHSRLYPPTVVTPYSIISWRVNPEPNWITSSAAGNEWRTETDTGWTVTATPGNEWRLTPEPIRGWLMEPSQP